ncbi:Acyl-lipid (8-3)-desaturase [Coccomyxa sp. Obi]|nr:Acyl-lipid (8-3)-desaturase [Coccomyxa sp. Obi]
MRRRGQAWQEDVSAAEVGTSPNSFTADEVAKHNNPSDCWLLIHGKVYDVTKWVPHHPGGSMIFVRAGGDCSQLFDSYHPVTTRLLLEKFYIGDLDKADSSNPGIVEYQSDMQEGEFYEVLKRRVEKFFRGNEINPRTSLDWRLKSVLILVSFAASFYATFFGFQSFAASALCACWLGVSMGQVGISIVHDVNHGSGLSTATSRYVLGAIVDLIGVSSFMWRQQHVVGHHAYTNLACDPDIRVSDHDVRRVAPHHPKQPYHAYQHVYLAALYGLLKVKSVLVDDFAAWARGSIGQLRLSRMTPGEAVMFWSCKVLYAAYYIALPAVCSNHSWRALAALWLIAELIAGWMLAFLFQVAHITGEVEFLDSAGGKVQRGWAAGQVATTADFSHGSWLWTQFSGGLNYQVVHHLFPNICHTHYPAIAPIVIDTCREFNVPYKIFPNFRSALWAHFAHLKEMGAAQLIPSFATVG